MNVDLFFFMLVKGRCGKCVGWASVILGRTDASQSEEVKQQGPTSCQRRKEAANTMGID